MEKNYWDTFFPLEKDIPETLAKELPVFLDRYLVGGTLRTWEGSFRGVFSPVLVRSDGGIARKIIGRYPLMTEKESLEALNAARGAFDYGRGLWPAMSIGQRIKRMEKLVSGLAVSGDRITKLLMWEIGKSRQDAQHELDRTIHYAKGVIDVFRRMGDKPLRVVEEHGIVGRLDRTPLGVVLCMGPFNYPLFETFTALVPALLAGNTVVFKLPRYGALIYHPLIEVLRDSFPAGVINMISGDGRKIIPPMLASGLIDGFAFIGTSGVASFLRGLHPKPQRLRCVLGLEAKNPAIVLADADLEVTVRECVSGALSFNGQRCAALKMFFVHTSIIDEFMSRFSEAVRVVKCGMPWDDAAVVTPLVEPGKPVYLRELVEDAVLHGARVVNEKGATVNNTFFYPAILYPVNPSMRIYREEQFGPVIPVVPYRDLDEPIRYVQESNYGQQASIFGRNKDELTRLTDFLVHQVSRVNINCQCQRSPDTAPFTGRKDSAEGSLSVSDAATVFTTPSLISARDTELNREIVEVVTGKESQLR
jgi:glyceraldehyde-3-phosphate dehydrogenase (NADP+)